MLSDDLLHLGAGLAEAVRTGRVTAELVTDAVLQLAGMAAQAAALEAKPASHRTAHVVSLRERRTS